MDTGETRETVCDLSRFPAAGAGNGSGGECVEKRITLPWKLPPGYHRLRVELRGRICGEATVISAPSRAWSPPEEDRRGWGIFLPLYALRSRRSPNGGDLTDLRDLMDWVEGMGGNAVGTLPLLSACSPEPFEPSPYAPCSRLAWNEFYLDVERAPGYAECGAARELLSSSAYREEAERLRRSPLVDHRRGMEMKRRVLEALARRFFRDGSGAKGPFRRFLSENPSMEDYAAFRAAWDARKAPWPTWPAPARDGLLREGDFGEQAKRYHLFVQWALHLQLRDLSSGPRKLLYLDLPLGASYDGYDVWRRRGLFALGGVRGSASRRLLHQGPGLGVPAAAPGTVAGGRARLLQGMPRQPASIRGHLADRPRHGAASLLLDPEGRGARGGDLRAVSRGGAVRRRVPGIGPAPGADRRGGPRHGSPVRAAGDGTARDPPDVRRAVRAVAGSRQGPGRNPEGPASPA